MPSQQRVKWARFRVSAVSLVAMLILFTLFYLVIDIWNFRAWTTFFVVIGMNSITIYLAPKLISFGQAANFLFGGLIDITKFDHDAGGKNQEFT